MTSDTSIDVREVVFINPEAESGYAALPEGVGEVADGVVTLLQNSRVPVRKELWQMLRGKLRGIGEVRINDGTNTFRVYLWLGCEPAIHILDAGMKKSPTGSDIPQWQQDRLVERRRRAAQDCLDQRVELDRALVDRAARRRQHEQETGQ